MQVFEQSWGLVVWTIVTMLLAGGVIAGAAFVVRYFVRLNRRVEHLARDVADLTRSGSEADLHDG